MLRLENRKTFDYRYNTAMNRDSVRFKVLASNLENLAPPKSKIWVVFNLAKVKITTSNRKGSHPFKRQNYGKK
jgi:hypothetical protein